VLAEQAEAAGQDVPPLRLVERALAEAKVERGQIECVAVGLGPGSYTGIRGAIALAQGWQLARGSNWWESAAWSASHRKRKQSNYLELLAWWFMLNGENITLKNMK